VLTLQQRLAQALALPIDRIQSQDMMTKEAAITALTQDELGWIKCIRGRHSIKWEEEYDIYLFTTAPIKYSSLRRHADHVRDLVKAAIALCVDVWYA